jgi:murein DD-endopeptidase MepM/ murein hydrolase activator NlpD
MNKVIVLDPGHGGNGTFGGSWDNRAVSPSGVLEKTMTLDFAQLVRDALVARSNEVKVLLTREKDENLGLKARAGIAAANQADLFLSIHFNVAGEGRGVEAWVRGINRGNRNYPADRAYAKRIADAVLKALRTHAPDTPDRGVKDDGTRNLGLGVLKPEWLGNVAGRSPWCRACLVLMESIGDPEVDRLLNTGDNVEGVRKTIAGSLASALLEELGLQFSIPIRPAIPVPVEPGPMPDTSAAPPTISGSVGRVEKNAVNNTVDVQTVQRLLHQAAKRLGDAAVDPGDATGRITAGDEDPTVRAIEAFQKRFTERPDGLIDLDRRTWKKLVGAVGIGVPTEGFCFPFAILPKEDWMSGPRRFGANRKGGARAHAACDLYADKGTIIHAVADGRVIRGPYTFYAGTSAIEIDHGKFIARYGEVQSDAFVREGDTVTMGQQIARVGHLQGIAVSSDMLHFELYDKSATGSLTVRNKSESKLRQDGVPYMRRRDLIDPTPCLNAWQHFLPAQENLAKRPQQASTGELKGTTAERTFSACKQNVLDRGIPPDSFLNELVDWGREAPDEIFAPNDRSDIYSSVASELGPWESNLQRKAAMLEVLRVLGGFESSWNWKEGRDTNNSRSNRPEAEEAGLFQISANSMNFDNSLRDLLRSHNPEGKTDSRTFIATTKKDHPFAIEFAARLLRFTVDHNGPVKRKEINKFLRRDAVAELQSFLA